MIFDFDRFIPRQDTGASKWRALEASGCQDPDVIPLSVADMEFQVAPGIHEALQKTVDLGIFGYAAVTDRYREAVCTWMAKRHNWQVRPEWLVQTYGVVPAIILAIHAFTQPGDGVIIQTPVYHPFKMTVESNDRRLVTNPLKNENGHYTMDFADLRAKAADPRTRLLLLCSPHNPVGRVWTREELTQLGQICIDNNVLIFSDEIHADLVFKPHRHTALASISEPFSQQCLTGTAASKTFNIAGLCASNIIIANAEHRAAYSRQLTRDIGLFNNALGIVATQAAYESGEAWLDALINYLDENRSVCETFCCENLPGLQVSRLEGTYLLWLDCRRLGLSDRELEHFLVSEARLFVVNGCMFGEEGSGFIRINIACPRHLLVKGLERLAAAIRRGGLA